MYKIKNPVGGYCFKGTKEECEKNFKEWNLEKEWRIEKDNLGYEGSLFEKLDKKENNTNILNKKKKANGQDTCDLILKKIKKFGLKTKNGIGIKYIEFIGPASGVYGTYVLLLENGKKYTLYSAHFKPNAEEINEYIPGYKEISRRKI